MNQPSGVSTARRALSILSVWIMAGCASNSPYHTSAGDGAACVNDPRSQECLNSYYQEFSSHDIAFVEFTERGNAFDDKAVHDVLTRIEGRAIGQGAVVVVFVHGWKHNASEIDSNVVDFKNAMEVMKNILGERYSKTKLGARKLIGVYVGWRGANIKLPLLEELTFWDRKAVAEELGSGGITRLLLELDRITAHEPRNVLVVIGHSFGGAIVVRALTDVLTERVTNRINDHALGFGNGVLVLNPAIEANQALPFVEAALQSPYKQSQLPLFISISTDADAATHYAFPLGQTIGLSTWKQTDLRRSYYHDRSAPNQPLPLRERHLDANTVGNFVPFLTHRLNAYGDGDTMKFTLKTCEEAEEGCKPMGWTTLSGQPTIGPLPKHYPLYFIKTDASVMTGHNDIFNQQVRSFVFTVIDDVVGRALRESEIDKGIVAIDQRPLIADPSRFADRMNQIWKTMEARSE